MDTKWKQIHRERHYVIIRRNVQGNGANEGMQLGPLVKRNP